MPRLLREDDVQRLLTMPEAVDAVEDAFKSLATGEAVNFPRQRSAAPGITLNVLCATSNKLDATAIKVYPIVRSDITVGSSFTVLVYRIATGALVGLLEANSLGQIRTGAASGVATRHLARSNSRVMALFGAGWQAESQAAAIAHTIPGLERIDVVARSRDRAQAFCHKMRSRIDVELRAVSDAEKAVAQSDIITTATGAHVPVFDGRWLKPGTHINAVGSNFANKQEIDATTVSRADCVVVDDCDVARIESGDLLIADKEVGLDWASIHPLANVVAGKTLGRRGETDITLFESHGIGLEDLAAACRALELARRSNVGEEIALR